MADDWEDVPSTPKADGWEDVTPQRRAADKASPTHVNAGLANLLAGTLGMPGDIAKGVINAPQMLFGAAATAAGRPDLAPTLNANTLGGGEDFRSLLRQTKLPGLSPDNPNPESKLGTLAYDMTSRGGMVPGSVLPAAASIAAEKIGGPAWGAAGALLPSGATAAFNAARAPGLAKAQAQNQVRDATLRPAQDAGYVTPPSTTNASMGINAAESFAGKAALKQEAELKNQQVTNRLSREELNDPAKGIHVPENSPITESLLNKLRNQASEPYRKLSAISPGTEEVLQRLRDVRAEAKDQWRHWDMQGVPDAKRQAMTLDAEATKLERSLMLRADLAGKPELVRELREARAYIAKSYDIERALNLGNGNVDAQIIGKALDRGSPLTGNLKIIAKFAEGPGKPFTREASKVPNPGTSAINAGASGVLGYEGFQHLGTPGLALAAIPFARGGVRQGLLSDTLQNILARPDYTPNMQPQGALQTILQQGLIANRGRQ